MNSQELQIWLYRTQITSLECRVEAIEALMRMRATPEEGLTLDLAVTLGQIDRLKLVLKNISA